MCGFSSAVLWAHKCGLYKPGFYKSSVHVIEECTVHAGGVASIALQEAVHCVHVTEGQHRYSSVLALNPGFPCTYYAAIHFTTTIFKFRLEGKH